MRRTYGRTNRPELIFRCLEFRLDSQTPRKAKDKEEDEEGSERGGIDGGEEGEGCKDEAGEEVDGEVLSHRGQVGGRVAGGNSCQQPT